jgi:hypothetical protein
VSFAEAAQRGPSPTSAKGPKCSIGKAVLSLEGAEREGLLTLLAPESGWQSEQIAAEMRNAGFDVQGVTVARHRRGGCKTCRELR